jgi:hypothetical protein
VSFATDSFPEFEAKNFTYPQQTATSCCYQTWQPCVPHASQVSLFTLLDHMSSAVPGVNRHHTSLTVH